MRRRLLPSVSLAPFPLLAILIFLGGAPPALSFSEEWRLENPSVPPLTLRGMAYGAGGLVVVGELGLVAARSVSGSWNATSAGPQYSLLDVAWSGARYVAVGREWVSLPSGALERRGAILTSGDGRRWQVVEIPTQAELNAVALCGRQLGRRRPAGSQ